MAQMAEGKLKNLGIALPTPPNPVANYVGFVRSGKPHSYTYTIR